MTTTSALASTEPLTMLSLVTAMIVLGVTLLTALVIAAIALKALLVTCPEDRLAVISGRPRTLPDGSQVGYRLCRGGRVLRLPFVESVDYLDLSSHYVPVAIANAFVQGSATPLSVEAAADVRVTTDPHEIAHAVERFLGTPASTLPTVATAILEGGIRAALAESTEVEARNDPEGLSERIMVHVCPDLAKCGLMLDMLHVLQVRPAR